jgi:S1-C subfamily serine protease
MKKILIAALLSCFLTPAVASWKDLNRTVQQTNFVVNDGCSGTLVDLEQRLILTAKHCVTGQITTSAKEVLTDGQEIGQPKRVVKFTEGRVSQNVYDRGLINSTTTYRTKLKAVSPDQDLALLQIVPSIPSKMAATVACTEPELGDPVYVVGNPMGILVNSVVAGIVSSVQRTYGGLGLNENPDKMLLQVSGGIVGGNSGGAVYSSDGQLIGVPVLGHRTNEVLGFAVPLADVRQFLIDNNTNIQKCD